MRKYGIYLETNFKIDGSNLFCQDVYSKFLGLVSEKLNITFSYLIKTTSNNSLKFNRIEKYNRLYKLVRYNNLVSLIPLYLFYYPFIRSQINKFINDIDCVIIMIPSPISKSLFKIAQKNNKKIILLVRQDIVEMTSNRFVGVKKFLAVFFSKYYLNFFFQNIDINTCVLASGEKLKNQFLPYSDNVFSIADSRYFDKDIMNPDDIKDVDFSQKLRFLFIGRLEVNKGIRELLNVILIYRDRIQLTIVGDGPMRNEIDNFVLINNLQSSIINKGFIGFGNDLLQIYKENDFFLFPSYSEGLPQVVLEAMANGCFVISTNVGSIPYIIQNNFNGILIKPHDLSDIITSIDLLFNNYYPINDIRISAISTARKYSFEKQVNIFENIINE